MGVKYSSSHVYLVAPGLLSSYVVGMGEHEQKVGSFSELREVRNHHLLLAGVIGAAIGGIALAFQWGVSLVSTAQDSFAPSGSLWQILIFCSAAGAIAGWLTQRFAPETGGSGIPHVEAVLEGRTTLRALPVLLVKFIGGALSIGSRFSLGREGPTIHLGASVADALCKLARTPPALRGHLIACGAGAGLAAAFNAPLAGFLFIIEELRRPVSSVTLGMALLGTVVADAIVRLYSGPVIELTLGEVILPRFSESLGVILIALGATVAGLLFNEAVIVGVKRTPPGIPRWVRGGMAGILVGVSIVLVPAITSDAQGVFDRFVGSAALEHPSVVLVFGILVAKGLLTAVCYASGVPGGIFAPMLVQGALAGLLLGELLTVFSLAVPSAPVCALVGMTAFFAASVRAPFTGVVLLAEMTNSFSLLLPLMAAALVGYILSELSGARPIYERLRELSFPGRAEERRSAL